MAANVTLGNHRRFRVSRRGSNLARGAAAGQGLLRLGGEGANEIGGRPQIGDEVDSLAGPHRHREQVPACHLTGRADGPGPGSRAGG